MSYEAGSKECRHLIEAKESLLSAMESLGNIVYENFTNHVLIQLQTTHDINTIKQQLYGIQKITFIQQLYV